MDDRMRVMDRLASACSRFPGLDITQVVVLAARANGYTEEYLFKLSDWRLDLGLRLLLGEDDCCEEDDDA